MEEQKLAPARRVWASYGLVLLIVLSALVVVAIQDARLAKAAAHPKPK